MTAPRMLTPEQRAAMLRSLKKGPALGDRRKLAEYTASLYTRITGRKREQKEATV